MTDQVKYTRVPLKSPWLSKINWVSVIGAVAAVLLVFGVNIDPDMQAKAAGGLIALQSIITIVVKTWFTDTVTPQAVGRDDA